MKKNIFLIFLSSFLFSIEDQSEYLKRIETHFLLEDRYSALKEAEKALKYYPSNLDLNKSYLKALAGCGYDLEAVRLLNSLPKNLSELKENSSLLEDISWAILKKGINSTQYATRLSSMVGMYLTRDARVVNVLNKMMNDSNAILRSVAINLATNYRDDPLKETISLLLDNEKVWLVRLEVIKAIGEMKIKEKAGSLKEILKDEKANFQERSLAIKALINIYDHINIDELILLLESPYGGFRSLGCELACHFKIDEVKEKILNLVFDPLFDVRINALNAVVLHFKKLVDNEQLSGILKRAYLDSNPFSAITAAWAGLIIDSEKGEMYLKRWLFDKYAENRRFASAAVAQAGIHGIAIGKYALKFSNDPFVKANVAIGLIGQRQEIGASCDILYDFIKKKKQMWMWDTSQNFLFRIIAPSEIRHTDHMPNYPEAIDQSVQLNILSLLAVLEDKRAEDGIKTFLKRKTWGITGLAAITLLQEGDDESINVLRTLLKDEERHVRIQAALALAMIGRDKSVLSILEEAYGQADFELKLNIIDAIAHISNHESVPFLVKVMLEPFQILRIAAASAIIQVVNL